MNEKLWTTFTFINLSTMPNCVSQLPNDQLVSFIGYLLMGFILIGRFIVAFKCDDVQSQIDFYRRVIKLVLMLFRDFYRDLFGR